MDRARFDAVVRRFSSISSRRSLVVGLPVAATATGSVIAKKRQNNCRGVCRRRLKRGKCKNRREGKPCHPSDVCRECRNGRCVFIDCFDDDTGEPIPCPEPLCGGVTTEPG